MRGGPCPDNQTVRAGFPGRQQHKKGGCIARQVQPVQILTCTQYDTPHNSRCSVGKATPSVCTTRSASPAPQMMPSSMSMFSMSRFQFMSSKVCWWGTGSSVTTQCCLLLRLCARSTLLIACSHPLGCSLMSTIRAATSAGGQCVVGMVFAAGPSRKGKPVVGHRGDLIPHGWVGGGCADAPNGQFSIACT